MSTDPSIGIEAWEKQRKQWTTPSQDFDKKTYFQKWEAFQFKDLADPKTKVIIYGQLIQKLQSFTQPIPLKYIIPVLVAGWQENGTWPKGVTVKDSRAPVSLFTIVSLHYFWVFVDYSIPVDTS